MAVSFGTNQCKYRHWHPLLVDYSTCAIIQLIIKIKGAESIVVANAHSITGIRICSSHRLSFSPLLPPRKWNPLIVLNPCIRFLILRKRLYFLYISDTAKDGLVDVRTADGIWLCIKPINFCSIEHRFFNYMWMKILTQSMLKCIRILNHKYHVRDFRHIPLA